MIARQRFEWHENNSHFFPLTTGHAAVYFCTVRH